MTEITVCKPISSLIMRVGLAFLSVDRHSRFHRHESGLSVASEHMGGHDLTATTDDINDEHKTPRGIRGYRLLGDNGIDFDTWKVAGSEFSDDLSDKLLMGASA